MCETSSCFSRYEAVQDEMSRMTRRRRFYNLEVQRAMEDKTTSNASFANS